MSWFTKMCRGFGELTHDIIAPVAGEKSKAAGTAPEQKPTVKTTEVKREMGEGVVSKEVVKHDVEVKRVDETTVLRRTTIEEIEVKREQVDGMDGQGDKGNGQ